MAKQIKLHLLTLNHSQYVCTRMPEKKNLIEIV